jgi:hypothetical protein
MHPELKSLLQSIDQGDTEKISKLVDWLQSQRDPRVELARNAAVLDPQEIADELVKIRSMRPSNNSFLTLLAELAVLIASGGFIFSLNLNTSHLESAPTTPRLWRSSTRSCLKDVEKALATKVIPTDVARAMTKARRSKIEKLLAAFQPAEKPSPVSLPESN